ncbi:hypothetical protein C0989_002359 [Termitomyces sp. Mn162]|nr:hypothetical protein C0989_002359 [Termitomyces sp. Mn162]
MPYVDPHLDLPVTQLRPYSGPVLRHFKDAFCFSFYHHRDKRRTTSSAAPARSTSVAATVTLKGIVIRGFHPKGKGKAPEEDDQEEEEIRVDPGEVPLPEADAEDDLEDHPTRPNPTPTLIPQSSWDLSKLERVLFLFLTVRVTIRKVVCSRYPPRRAYAILAWLLRHFSELGDCLNEVGVTWVCSSFYDAHRSICY